MPVAVWTVAAHKLYLNLAVLWSAVRRLQLKSSPRVRYWNPDTLQSPVPAMYHRAPFTFHSARMEQCKRKKKKKKNWIKPLCSAVFLLLTEEPGVCTRSVLGPGIILNTQLRGRGSLRSGHIGATREKPGHDPRPESNLFFKPETKSGRKTVLFTQNAKNINVSDDISHYNSDFLLDTRGELPAPASCQDKFGASNLVQRDEEDWRHKWDCHGLQAKPSPTHPRSKDALKNS